MVRYYSGVDGLKTGFTSDAGYCLTATAKKNNMRLITVVMNEPSGDVRSSETASLLDYGYNMYTIDNILNKDTSLGKVKINLGNKEYTKAVPKEDINILNSKTKNKRNVSYKVETNKVNAPIKVGDTVGKIKVLENKKVIMTIDLTVTENIKKANIFKVFYRNVFDIIKGNIL